MWSWVTANHSVGVSSRPTKSRKDWGVSATTSTGVSRRFLPKESQPKGLHARVESGYLPPAGAPRDTANSRDGDRRIDQHVRNDCRSNRAGMFICEFHVAHTQRRADAKQMRPGKDATFYHWPEIVDL